MGVVSHFTKDDWDSIVSSINTEDEWGRFLDENCHFFRCYTLKRISDEEPLAMVYLVNEDLNWGKVSIHGGGWGATSFLFRGYAVMIIRLLSLEIKVQTHTSLNNTRAIRFNRAIGFVPYRYADNTVFMWISQRTLTSSKVYRWLYEKWGRIGALPLYKNILSIKDSRNQLCGESAYDFFMYRLYKIFGFSSVISFQDAQE